MSDHTSCSIEPELLSAFVDEELSEERMDELREHVRGCEPCEERLSRLQEARGAARTLDPPSAPDAFVSDVRERVEETVGGERSVRSNRPSDRDDGDTGSTETTSSSGGGFDHPMRLAAAAVFLMAVTAGLVFVMQRSTERSTEPVAKLKQDEDSADTSSSAADSTADFERERAQEASDAPVESSEGTGGFKTQTETKERNARPMENSDMKSKKTASAEVEADGADRAGESYSSASSSPTEEELEPSPLLVRLSEERATSLKALTSALSVLDAGGVELRAFLPAGKNRAADKPRSAYGGGEEDEKGTTGTVRTLSLDLSSEQLSSLVEQNARLELTLREEKAKLFLGALVQQGLSPDVLAANPERGTSTEQLAPGKEAGLAERTEQEEGEEQAREREDEQVTSRAGEVRRTLVALQQTSIRLQQSRSTWGQQASDTDSGSRNIGDAISIATLLRFIRRYDETQAERTDDASSPDIESNDSHVSGAAHQSVRREVLQQWVRFLEERPASWSTNVRQETEKKRKARLDEAREPERNLSNPKSKNDYVDVHLRIPGKMPASDPRTKRGREQGQHK